MAEYYKKYSLLRLLRGNEPRKLGQRYRTIISVGCISRYSINNLLKKYTYM